MSVANIFNVPSTREEMAVWSTLHMIWHRSCLDRVRGALGLVLAEYVLDPAEFTSKSTWLANHQSMHSQLDAVLGIPTYDLVDVDWEDDAQRAAWFSDHAELTRSESDALGIAA
jgi:hypothetical protein